MNVDLGVVCVKMELKTKGSKKLTKRKDVHTKE